jgi:hypothetical protein
MPPVFLAFAAAAGFFAAARLIASMIDSAPPDQMQARDQQAQATASEQARDLGRLEWDAQSGVYRPKT